MLVPRWAGTERSDWYPWFERTIAPRGCSVCPLDVPEAPTIEGCVRNLQALMKGRSSEDTWLIGHSVGCQAVLRFLETCSPDFCAAGVLCVAGWWTIDEPWETIRPWIETPIELPKVKAAARGFSVLLSDNDPFTADHQKNAQRWREGLGAQVHMAPGRKHFNQAEEPEVLKVLQALG